MYLGRAQLQNQGQQCNNQSPWRRDNESKACGLQNSRPFGLADMAYLFKGLTLELKFVGGISELSCDNCQYKDLVLSEWKFADGLRTK